MLLRSGWGAILLACLVGPAWAGPAVGDGARSARDDGTTETPPPVKKRAPSKAPAKKPASEPAPQDSRPSRAEPTPRGPASAPPSEPARPAP
ncbi:MAG: hypothetical protein Q8P41_11940, partial [Pseudomonadota bacterium]|nr:hypothetical protein [Pseudomonadota bacterium]